MSDTKRVSLSELRRQADRGDIAKPEADVDGLDMPDGFWDDARPVYRSAKTPISLRVDEDILAFFKEGGTGHLTRMHAVLRAYVDAKAKKAG